MDHFKGNNQFNLCKQYTVQAGICLGQALLVEVQVQIQRMDLFIILPHLLRLPQIMSPYRKHTNRVDIYLRERLLTVAMDISSNNSQAFQAQVIDILLDDGESMHCDVFQVTTRKPELRFFCTVLLGSSHQGMHINKQNGIGGPEVNVVNNLRLAGSGSGSESASDHTGHSIGNGHTGVIGSSSNLGSDHGAGFGQSFRPQPAVLRAVPPPVITTSTILSHDGMGRL